MSRPGKQLATLAIAAIIGFAVTGAIVYRNSFDGQLENLWFQILWDGVLALIALRLVDKAFRLLAETVRQFQIGRSGA